MTRRPVEEIGGGTNARPLNDPIGTTGPGIPDEALAKGETLEDELVLEEGEEAAAKPEPPGAGQTGRP
jgi:hypothetical protein